MRKKIANSVVRAAMGSFALVAFSNCAFASERGSLVKYESKKKKRKACGCGHLEPSMRETLKF